MKNHNEELMNNELMTNEPAVSAKQILSEITPLLIDYFEGDISFYGERITYILPNGQKFVLTAELSA